MFDGNFLFIGRHEARDAFHSLLSLREQKSSVYVQAGGGLGKTRYLRWIIAEYQKNPRWYFSPPDSIEDPLVDFYELRNRSVAGLRHSIIERLGWEYFSQFKQSEREMHEAEARLEPGKEMSEGASASAVFALRRRTDDLFFKNFKDAISTIRKYVVLLFDTFEIAHRRRVGRWFLNEFLQRQETSGCFIIFAGRPPGPALPARVRAIEFGPWSEGETIEYLDKNFKETPYEFQKEEAYRIHEATEGYPLLVDMAVYTRNSSLAPLDELINIPRARLEWALINRVAHSKQVPEHAVILEMAYLRRRFDQRIFEFRQKERPAYGGFTDYDTLVHALQHDPAESKKGFSSITKYRPKDKVLTLHDEVQRMIAKHAFSRDWDLVGPRNEWKEMVDELYREVVEGWYKGAIDQADLGVEKELLTSERLGYELDYDVKEGLKLYQQHFEQAKKYSRFSFNELIWGEIIDRLEDEVEKHKFAGREYELCYGQADWLWSTNQFEGSAEAYNLIVDKYTPDPKDVIRRMDALASLGHAFMRLGRYEEARGKFEEGILHAEDIENKTWISAFQQNMGQLLQGLNQWSEAEKWFTKAVQTAEGSKNREAIALARGHLGHLQAMLGHYDNAILNCQKAVALRQEILVHLGEEAEDLTEAYYESIMSQPSGYYSLEGLQTRLASAYMRLADAYRYSGPQNLEKALRYYEKALEQLPIHYEYRVRCEVLQGLGIAFHAKGVNSRLEQVYRSALDLQHQAFEKLNDAITLCRKHGLESLLPKAFHRMAHVFYEISTIEREKTVQGSKSLAKLLGRLGTFLLPEEDNYSDRLRERKPFTELDTIAKAQRLFEVSHFEAEQPHLQDYNTSLDSLIEACEIALQRGRPRDVSIYANLAQVPSQAYQQDLFLALADLALADLDLNKGQLDSAVARYVTNFPIIARAGGYGYYLLEARLTGLGQKLLSMPHEQAFRLCDEIIREWEAQGLSSSHPLLIAQMWEYRNTLAEKTN